MDNKEEEIKGVVGVAEADVEEDVKSSPSC